MWETHTKNIDHNEQDIIDFVKRLNPNADFIRLQGMLNDLIHSVYDYGYEYSKKFHADCERGK